MVIWSNQGSKFRSNQKPSTNWIASLFCSTYRSEIAVESAWKSCWVFEQWLAMDLQILSLRSFGGILRMYLKSDSDLYKRHTWTDEEYLNVFVVISLLRFQV